MTTPPPVQLPRGACQLLLAAERLFGLRGVDGVTIRELLEAAGQANKAAVHHYFGSKEGLLEAVRDMRLPQLEAARAHWIARLPAPAPATATAYLGALFLPVLEVMDDQELESYSQFNLRLLHDNIEGQSFVRMAAASPHTRDIVTGLRACFPALPDALFRARIRLAVGVLLGGVAEWRALNHPAETNPYPSEAAFWADVLIAAAGVLQASDERAASAFTTLVVRPTRQRYIAPAAGPTKGRRRSVKV